MICIQECLGYNYKKQTNDVGTLRSSGFEGLPDDQVQQNFSVYFRSPTFHTRNAEQQHTMAQ